AGGAWCQNGGGSGSGGGSGWVWWARRCWNSCHVVVKVWTSQGGMRAHSSRAGRGGLGRIVEGGGAGSKGVLVGVVGWVTDSLMGSRCPASCFLADPLWGHDRRLRAGGPDHGTTTGVQSGDQDQDRAERAGRRGHRR